MSFFLAESPTHVGAVVTEFLTHLLVLTVSMEGEGERKDLFAKLKKGFCIQDAKPEASDPLELFNTGNTDA